MDGGSETAVVLLCGGVPDLAALSAARQRMQQQLEAVGALRALIESATQEAWQQHGSSSSLQDIGSPTLRGDPPGSMLALQRLPAAAGGGPLGATPLLHFAYKLTVRQQYVMSPFSRALSAGGLQQVSNRPPLKRRGHAPVAASACCLRG